MHTTKRKKVRLTRWSVFHLAVLLVIAAVLVQAMVMDTIEASFDHRRPYGSVWDTRDGPGVTLLLPRGSARAGPWEERPSPKELVSPSEYTVTTRRIRTVEPGFPLQI